MVKKAEAKIKEIIEENGSGDEEIKMPRKVTAKNVAYTDADNVIVPKRKIKYSRIFDVYCVRHNEEINIDEHETVCRTDWNPQLVAREFCVSELEKDKKVTGRRDIFVRERGVSSVKTYGYVVRRKRVEEKDVKKVQFPGKSETPATFNFNTNVNHARINKANLRSFKQQCMKRLGATDEEIENVPLEADKNSSPDSDSEPEEDAPEPKVKVVKQKKERIVLEGGQTPVKVTKKDRKIKAKPENEEIDHTAVADDASGENEVVKVKKSKKKKAIANDEVGVVAEEEEHPKKTKSKKNKKQVAADEHNVDHEDAEEQ